MTTPAATVKVTAPSTLEAGFTFEAVADGKRTFTGELSLFVMRTVPGRRAQMGLRLKYRRTIWLTQSPFFLYLFIYILLYLSLQPVS
jgi:hypothetical protein